MRGYNFDSSMVKKPRVMIFTTWAIKPVPDGHFNSIQKILRYSPVIYVYHAKYITI